jgi:hypothetical protein
MFEKLTSSINDGILAIYAVILFVFWKILRFFSGKIVKFLEWCAKVFAKAASREIKDMIKDMLLEWLKPLFDDLRKEFDAKLEELKSQILVYKNEKHYWEGEAKALKKEIKNLENSREDLIYFVNEKQPIKHCINEKK